MAKKVGDPRRYCECGAELGRGDKDRCVSCRYHDGEPGAVEQALADQRADKSLPPEDKNGRPIRVGDKVVVYGQEGVVIRIQPGGYPVVQVNRHANAWQPDEVEVKSMAAACRVCGLRPAQDDGLCHDPKCPSYEARVKALRAKYKAKVGIIVAGRYLDHDEAEAYLQDSVNRLFAQRPTASPEAVIDRIRQLFGVTIRLVNRQVVLG